MLTAKLTLIIKFSALKGKKNTKMVIWAGKIARVALCFAYLA